MERGRGRDRLRERVGNKEVRERGQRERENTDERGRENTDERETETENVD